MTAVPLASRVVNGLLAIQPLADFAKHQARSMMIKRAESIGVPWRQRVEELGSHDWDDRFGRVQNPELTYREYYLCSFHAYANGNLNWDAALEQEVAAKAVHAKIWPEAGASGDARLRQSYHDLLKTQLPRQPQTLLDLGCGVGLSTFTLQETYPQAQVTGIDLSPYFLAVAQYNQQQRLATGSGTSTLQWIHAPAEATGLPEATFDLVSIFLVCHELPQSATINLFREARRLLHRDGHLAIMDMNPQCEFLAKMPPYILTLLKSTEPYLDEYFTLDIEEALVDAGFQSPTITPNSPRHRTIIAQNGDRS